ncbi:hypothetical protein [Dactylosporangium sp. NPDC051541]|uniref:hypothetical protein n=1 Tax=Dactylosporangium sp. NPDC051541 TaxID=3363977 RepID=UPI00379A5BC6
MEHPGAAWLDGRPGRDHVRMAGTSPGRRGSPVLMVLLAAGGWGLLAVVDLLGVWIANLWLLAWLILGAAWLVAITATAAAVAMLWLRHGPRWAIPTLALSLAAPLMFAAIDWTYTFAHGFYRLNQADFAAVAALARTGGLDDTGYYGEPLPPDLRHLSINGRAAHLGATDVFLPAWAGIPDGAIGYAHLTNPDPAHTYDCFADPCRIHWSLGDGWYWLDRT